VIGCWHALPSDPNRPVQIALGARVGGHRLVVEHYSAEQCWRWAVLSYLGHEIEGGVAPDAHSAERMAEEAAFHIHPPSVGDWVARLL
jgi:hypothetical protein